MVALRPSVASYARIAYARELIGDLRGARAAMQLAADAAAGQREPAAWANVELAKLDLRAGRARACRAALRLALALLPGYVYAPSSSRASRRRAAACPARSASRGAPRRRSRYPQFVALLADLHERAGDRKRRGGRSRPSARSTGCSPRTACAPTSSRRSSTPTTGSAWRRSSRVRAPRELRGPRSTATTRSPGRSPARAGCDEARPWSERSLRLGTRDALLFFHRGEIERCAGDPRAAAPGGAARRSRSTPPSRVRWAPCRARLGDPRAKPQLRNRGEHSVDANHRRPPHKEE